MILAKLAKPSTYAKAILIYQTIPWTKAWSRFIHFLNIRRFVINWSKYEYYELLLWKLLDFHTAMTKVIFHIFHMANQLKQVFSAFRCNFPSFFYHNKKWIKSVVSHLQELQRQRERNLIFSELVQVSAEILPCYPDLSPPSKPSNPISSWKYLQIFTCLVL